MSKVNETIVGTWWLCSQSNELFLTKGPNKPIQSNNSWKIGKDAETGWLWVRDSKGNSINDVAINRNDSTIKYTSDMFADLNFPEMKSYECKEIEITKSGRVFVYD